MQQLVQRALVIRVAQIELAGPFATAGIDHQRRNRRQVRSRDQQHIGAVGGQRAPCHRAGDDAREVEHADAGQRPGIDIDFGMGRNAGNGIGGASPIRSMITGGSPAAPEPAGAPAIRHRSASPPRPCRRPKPPLEVLGLPLGQRGAHGILVVRAMQAAARHPGDAENSYAA
jgi:hypothetical protein